MQYKINILAAFLAACTLLCTLLSSQAKRVLGPVCSPTHVGVHSGPSTYGLRRWYLVSFIQIKLSLLGDEANHKVNPMAIVTFVYSDQLSSTCVVPRSCLPALMLTLFFRIIPMLCD